MCFLDSHAQISLRVAQVSFIPLITWEEEVAAAPEPDFGFGARRFHMTCCRKQAGGDIVLWQQCRPGDVFTRTLGCNARSADALSCCLFIEVFQAFV